MNEAESAGGPPEALIRAFVAVALPDAVKAAIAAQIEVIARQLPNVKWTPEENLHVTLAFLGQVVQRDLERIWAAVHEAVVPCAAIPLDVRGLGAFPTVGKASVLWAGVYDPTGRLGVVAGAVEAVARASGYPVENRSFRAHVTIGRALRQPVDARAVIAGSRFGVFSVDAIDLFESRTGGSSSQYIQRGRFQIGQGVNHGDVREERHLQG